MKQTLTVTNTRTKKVINTFEIVDEKEIYKNLFECYKKKVEKFYKVVILKPHYKKIVCRIYFTSEQTGLDPLCYTYETELN